MTFTEQETTVGSCILLLKGRFKMSESLTAVPQRKNSGVRRDSALVFPNMHCRHQNFMFHKGMHLFIFCYLDIGYLTNNLQSSYCLL